MDIQRSREKKVWIWAGATILFFFILSRLVMPVANAMLHGDINLGWITYADMGGGALNSALALDSQGRVWVMIGNRLYPGYPDSRDPIEIPVDSVSIKSNVYLLAIDQQDRVWTVGSADKTHLVFLRETDGNWRMFKQTPGEDETIIRLFVDAQNQAWLTGQYKVEVIDPEDDRTTFSLNHPTPEAQEFFYTLVVDHQKNNWKLDGKKLLRQKPRGEWEALGSMEGYSLAIDDLGQIWVGGNDFVRVYSPDLKLIKNFSIGERFTKLAVKGEGEAWINASNGLTRLDLQSGMTTINSKNSGLPDDSPIHDLAVDKEGRVWIIQSAGLSAYNPAVALSDKTRNKLVTIEHMLLPVTFLSVLSVILLATALSSPPASLRFKLRHLVFGIAGWFLTSLVFYIIIMLASFIAEPYAEAGLVLLAPLIILQPILYVIILVYLFIKRRWMAVGFLAAFILNTAIVVAVLLRNPIASYPDLFTLLKPFFLPNII